MVIVMFKFVFSAMAFSALVLSGITTAQAAPDVAPYLMSKSGAAEAPRQSRSPFASRAGLLQVRDIRSGGGGGNGCWNACFTDFDECLGIRTKNLCVSRVKTCLETCDRLSNRPGM